MSSSGERGTIYIMYNYWNRMSLPAKSSVMLGWEEGTDQESSPEDWLDMISDMHKCTKSMVVVKLHTRWNYTPSKLHRFYPMVQENCFRGCSDRGTQLHIFWSCGAIKTIWLRVSSKVALIMGIQMTLIH